MPLHFATDNSDEIQHYDAFPQNRQTILRNEMLSTQNKILDILRLRLYNSIYN